MSQATPELAAFSEMPLADHMQRVKNALVERGYVVRRLLPARFTRGHRERVSIQLSQDGQPVYVESVLNVNAHGKQGLKGGLSFTVATDKSKKAATLAMSDELKFGALPVNIDTAQAMLERALKAFSPERIAHLVNETLAA